MDGKRVRKGAATQMLITAFLYGSFRILFSFFHPIYIIIIITIIIPLYPYPFPPFSLIAPASIDSRYPLQQPLFQYLAIHSTAAMHSTIFFPQGGEYLAIVNGCKEKVFGWLEV